MVSKLIGYIISAIGLIGLFISNEKILPGIPLLNNFSPKTVLYPAMVITALGIIILITTAKGSEKAEKEVPIYKGKKIVGYRRH